MIREKSVVVIFSLVAGFLGGVLSNWMWNSPSVLAQGAISGDKQVVAEEFRLVDSTGRTVSVWGPSHHGAQISFGKGQKKSYAVMGILPNGDPGMSLFDSNGSQRADFRVGPGGFPTLRLNDTERDKILLFGAHGIGFFDGRLRGRLVLTRDGTLNLDLTNQDSQLSSTFMLLATGKPTLALSDQAGKIVWSVP